MLSVFFCVVSPLLPMRRPMPPTTISMTFERFIFIGKLVIGNHRILSYENRMHSISFSPPISFDYFRLVGHMPFGTQAATKIVQVLRFLSELCFCSLSACFFFTNKISMGNTQAMVHFYHIQIFGARFKVGADVDVGAGV